MQVDNSMYEKISNDIKTIIYNDPEIDNFCVLHVNENKNKSPVLYAEHNLALESWCVKYLYGYINTELFKLRHLLRKRKLFTQKEDDANKFLIVALLLHPDVSTFWNMRRELIEQGVINLDIELRITKLILSNKTKSNEAFSYRKWILNRLFKCTQKSSIRQLLDQEFLLTVRIAQNSSNNYHAWNHRIWMLENIFAKYYTPDMPEYLNLILEQIEIVSKWISIHISENVGFHYKQYLSKCFLKNKCIRNDINVRSRSLIESSFKIGAYSDDLTYLATLYGERKQTSISKETLIELNNYANLVVILLTDLIYFLKSLDDFLPEQLTVWYHRRFIIYYLLKIGYDYHRIFWDKNSQLEADFNVKNEVIGKHLPCIKQGGSVDFHKETSSKMPKFEQDLVESSLLYASISDFELRYMKICISTEYDSINRTFAIRHFKYLKYVLGFYKDISLY